MTEKFDIFMEELNELCESNSVSIRPNQPGCHLVIDDYDQDDNINFAGTVDMTSDTIEYESEDGETVIISDDQITII